MFDSVVRLVVACLRYPVDVVVAARHTADFRAGRPGVPRGGAVPGLKGVACDRFANYPNTIVPGCECERLTLPLLVELRDRAGAVVGTAGELSDDIDATLPDLNFAEYPLLAGVDRCGETVFNEQQMTQLIIEIDRLADDGQPARRRRFLRAVGSLCYKGMNMSHVKLIFIGD